MSDLRQAIANWTRFVADLRDELPHEQWSELVKKDSHLVDAAGRYADLLDVVEAGGRIIAETPCPHGEFEDGHLIKGGHPESSIAYCATYPERRVVLGDDT